MSIKVISSAISLSYERQIVWDNSSLTRFVSFVLYSEYDYTI